MLCVCVCVCIYSVERVCSCQSGPASFMAREQWWQIITERETVGVGVQQGLFTARAPP